MKNKYLFCLLLLTQLQNFAFGASKKSVNKKASIPARPVPTDSQKAYILATLKA